MRKEDIFLAKFFKFLYIFLSESIHIKTDILISGRKETVKPKTGPLCTSPQEAQNRQQKFDMHKKSFYLNHCLVYNHNKTVIT